MPHRRQPRAQNSRTEGRRGRSGRRVPLDQVLEWRHPCARIQAESKWIKDDQLQAKHFGAAAARHLWMAGGNWFDDIGSDNPCHAGAYGPAADCGDRNRWHLCLRDYCSSGAGRCGLWALSLWALAHVVPNGDLAHVILFGNFAAFALLGQRLVDRRRQRDMGNE